MKNLIRPSAILLYLLILPLFFLIGLAYVLLSGSAEDQGLAGGAIVLMTSLFSAALGLFFAFIYANRSSTAILKKTNKVLASILLTVLIILGVRHFAMAAQVTPMPSSVPSRPMTIPASQHTIYPDEIASSTPYIDTQQKSDSPPDMGMGVFIPDLDPLPITLGFYSLAQESFRISEGRMVDSLTFKVGSYGDVEISYAPPWFQPFHSKLDYGILYLRVLSVSMDHLLVIGNESDDRKAIVSREEGTFMYWPDFFMSVYAVELPDDRPQDIHVRPFDSSGILGAKYDHLHAIEVQG